jgi:hypothetical protein
MAPAPDMNAPCRICGAASNPFGRAKVLGRHPVQYFRCSTCGFVQTEKPYWLAEAYQDALSGLDVGAVSRNLRLQPIVQAVIQEFFHPARRFVDYGGGSGLFVRLMRDAGYDFWWQDKYARNVFARGFEAKSGQSELLTAFEVFEHLEDPAGELNQMLTCARNVLFSTVLLPAETPQPGQWWYYGLEHGQHVALYSVRALEQLGQRFGLHLCSAGELHLLSERPINARAFRRATRPRIASWINRFSRRRSLTDSDFQAVLSTVQQRFCEAAERDPEP